MNTITRKIIIIRNANQSDFGGAERFPVFLATELNKLDYRSIIVSRSKQLLNFAQKNNIETINGWWWSRQHWSGKKAILFPIYLLWQLILFFWYLIVFIKINPSIIHIQSKDDFIAATIAGRNMLRLMKDTIDPLRLIF